jgi:hypothetical protein
LYYHTTTDSSEYLNPRTVILLKIADEKQRYTCQYMSSNGEGGWPSVTLEGFSNNGRLFVKLKFRSDVSKSKEHVTYVMGLVSRV